MTMQKTIEAILTGLPNVKVKPVGDLWQVSVGGLSGARKNGESLARDLRAQYEYVRARERAQGEPEPVSIPAFLHIEDEPEPATPDPRLDLQAARIAELEAALAEAKATQEVSVPSDLSDLIETADTPYQTNEKLLARLREVLGLIGLAEDAGGRAAPELYKRRDRLESGIRWNRGRLAEQI